VPYFTNELVEEIQDQVRIYYADVDFVRRWNASRAEGVLRLLTGYAWIERGGARRVRCGFKTKSVALRDAYYTVVVGAETAPGHEAQRVARANEIDVLNEKKKKSNVVKLRAVA
jgi:hypothetical protein